MGSRQSGSLKAGGSSVREGLERRDAASRGSSEAASDCREGEGRSPKKAHHKQKWSAHIIGHWRTPGTETENPPGNVCVCGRWGGKLVQ
jgi:hypothetical protein